MGPGLYPSFSTRPADWQASTISASERSRSDVNAILFDDPRRNDAEGTFSCTSGGVIAVGGPYFNTSTRGFGGKSWHQAIEADIVTNDGTECYFRNNPRVAEEVFAHELGHTLGSGHSPTWDALMYARAHDDGRGAILAADDRADAASMYPGGGSGGTNTSVLNAPSQLAGRVLSRTQVRLTWRDNSTGEKSFRIEAKLRGGTFREVLPLTAGSTSAVIGGLRPGKVYVFRVRAVAEKLTMVTVRPWKLPAQATTLARSGDTPFRS